jgi:hypothetical protein
MGLVMRVAPGVRTRHARQSALDGAREDRGTRVGANTDYFWIELHAYMTSHEMRLR